jgi:hypothetical protein
MAMQSIARKQGQVTYTSNAKFVFPLSRGNVYRQLMLRLKGAPTLTGANNTRAKTLNGDAWACVKKIEIISGGVNVIRSYTGRDLWWLNYFLYGKSPRLNLTTGDGATANHSFDQTLIIPFDMTRARLPVDALLDTRNLDQLTLEVTWGTYTDINADATAWTTNPTIDVVSREVFNVPNDARFATMRNFGIDIPVTATSPALSYQLPIGPQYRGFIINATDAGVDSSAVINNIKVYSAARTYLDIPGSVFLPQYTRQWYNLEDSYDLGGNIYQPPMKSTQAVRDGWYYFDNVMDGMMTEAIESLGLSELKLEFDVTVGGGTTNIHVMPLQFWPLRAAA